jgi:ethanolamine utilization microcompartment shell protein EutL
MDSFEINFDGFNKAKHAGRALEYLAGDNPKAVRKALEQTAKELS